MKPHQIVALTVLLADILFVSWFVYRGWRRERARREYFGGKLYS